MKDKEIVIDKKNTDKSPNNKTTIKKYWWVIILISIIFIIGIVLFKSLKYSNKNIASNTDEQKQEEIVYGDFEWGSFYIYDMKLQKDDSLIETSVYNINDKIVFNLGYEINHLHLLKQIKYKIRVGKGLEFIKDEKPISNSYKFKKNGDEYIINILDKEDGGAGMFGFDTIEHYFKVKDDATSEELYIEFYDIKLKTLKKEYYKYGDVRVNLTLKSDKYYIYEEKYDDEYYNIRISDTEINEENVKKVGEYKCDSKDCNYITHNGNYILFDDFGLVAYDYKKNKTHELNYPEIDYRVEQLVADDKIYGIIVENDGKYGYYSFELDKYVIPMSEKNFLYYDSAGFIENRGDERDIVDLQGNKFVPDISKLENIEGTDFYYYTYYCGIEDCLYKFYNKNGNSLADDKEIWDYTITDSKEIILFDENDNTRFEIYNSSGLLTYTSKNYKSVYHLWNVEDYLAVIDTDNYLKLINSKEEVIATFTEMTEEKYFHDMISGWYEYDNKNGIYLVVGDPSVTVEEVLKNNKDFSESDIEWIKESSGYEYYYIPKTGETGKIPTAIGGYAKPVLYLYPKNDNTKINVTFEKPGLLTTTYPKFKGSWNVTANKNGDLYDSEGKYYYGLYWEEEGSTKVDFSEGFYVTKENAIEFLEEKLSIIGLSDRERNEFIMYWLPILEKNEKNLVYFELTEEREEFNKLNITPKPDSLLRMAIHVKKVNKNTNIKEQKLKTFERVGFTAVEWGGVVH